MLRTELATLQAAADTHASELEREVQRQADRAEAAAGALAAAEKQVEATAAAGGWMVLDAWLLC